MVAFNHQPLISTDRGRQLDFHHRQPSESEVWQLLEQVPDPELPMVSVVDLGIVRSAELESVADVGSAGSSAQQQWLIQVTPTYSGCPATDYIANDIYQTLKRAGVPNRVQTVLSPAWCSTWMSDTGRKALTAAGIAPPVDDLSTLTCPQCGSNHVSLINQFGSTACKALYRCTSCLEPFDYFKTI